MKKLFLLIVISVFTANFISAKIEKKLDKIIKTQNIAVSNQTEQNIDTLEKLVMQTRSDSVSVDDLTNMTTGEGSWIKNNWSWLLTTLIFLLEIFLRVAPTNKDWSIVNKILSILIWIWRLLPNNAKVRGNVIKRGFDIRIKKTIDSYKNRI